MRRFVVPLTLCATLFGGVAACDEQQASSPPGETNGVVGGLTTTLEATIDGSPVAFDEVTAKLIAEPGVHVLRLTGARDPVPDGVDDESSLEIVVELGSGALAQLEPGAVLDIDGTSTFPEPANGYGDMLADQEITHARDATAAAAVSRIWVRNWCFCSRYGAQQQALTGSITLTDVSESHLKGSLHLDLDGAIPFYGTGFGGGVKGTFDGTFDAAIPVAR